MWKILKEVDLKDKADSYTKTLSGGQKRKLSVGIAFIGNPKVPICSASYLVKNVDLTLTLMYYIKSMVKHGSYYRED